MENEIEKLATELYPWKWVENEEGNFKDANYEIREAWIEGYKAALSKLPISVEEAGIAAVRISERVIPELTAYDQAFFIAGFQECIKYLQSLKQKTTV